MQFDGFSYIFMECDLRPECIQSLSGHHSFDSAASFLLARSCSVPRCAHVAMQKTCPDMSWLCAMRLLAQMFRSKDSWMVEASDTRIIWLHRSWFSHVMGNCSTPGLAIELVILLPFWACWILHRVAIVSSLIQLSSHLQPALLLQLIPATPLCRVRGLW